MKCGATGKRGFKTHEGALIRGGEILTGQEPLRDCIVAFTAYRCEFCGMYHLSSIKGHDKTQNENEQNHQAESPRAKRKGRFNRLQKRRDDCRPREEDEESLEVYPSDIR